MAEPIELVNGWVPYVRSAIRAAGREVDVIPLRAKDGSVVLFEYDARPDFPVPAATYPG